MRVVAATRGIGPWGNPALLGSDGHWRVGAEQSEAATIGVREVVGVGEFRAGRIGVGLRLVNRRSDKLFDDPDLAASGFRVEDDLLALGTGIDLGHTVRVGATIGALWSTVLGSNGTGYSWEVGAATSGSHCQAGATWGTRQVRMSWSDAAGTEFITPAEYGGALGLACGRERALGNLGVAAALQQDIWSSEGGRAPTRATAVVTWSSMVRVFGGVVVRGRQYVDPTVWEFGGAVTAGRVTLLGGGRFEGGSVPGTVYSFGLAISHS